MGKCVSKSSEIHHSVLTLAASEQDFKALTKIALEECEESGNEDDGVPKTSKNNETHVSTQKISQLGSSETMKLLVISAIPGCANTLSTLVTRSNATGYLSKSTLLSERDNKNEDLERQTKLGRHTGEIHCSGQTESKKSAKGKHAASITESVQTKGTAMSFGFRKKLSSTTPTKFKKLLEVSDSKHKKQDKCNNKPKGESSDRKSRTVIDSVGRDDNGNAEVLTKIDFKKMTVSAANANERRLPAAATTPSSPVHTNVDKSGNNNCSPSEGNDVKPTEVVRASNLKRRSKSAHAGRAGAMNSNYDSEPKETAKPTQPKTLTFNLNQNKTIEYQRRQFFEQPHSSDAGMQANVVVHQTPRVSAASYSKFTLQTVSLPKPQFPVSISLSATTPTTPDGGGHPPLVTTATGGARAKQQHAMAKVRPLDQKSAKQIANNSTRRGFSGTREISADSGIASIDMALDGSGSSGGSGADSCNGFRTASPKRSRSRPRQFQMVMSGRHTFEVRDVDDPPSSESSSFVEPLALPKLPTDSNQMLPLPLNGLVRSNTALRREVYEHNMARRQVEIDKNKAQFQRNLSSEESFDEEKLYLDCSTSEKSTAHARAKESQTSSSKTSSPGSSVMSSWCNGGESLAAKDFSNMSITSSDDGKKDKNNLLRCPVEKDEPISLGLNEDDLSFLNTEMQISTISSISDTTNLEQMPNNSPKALSFESSSAPENVEDSNKAERPNSFNNEQKFAEMVLASSSGFLLEDETSPTDSLVSSTESDEMASKLKKHKMNEELQEKDIDEISPELEVGSPISPGTPTHASHSLSLSDCGNLIDDEIADQPALLFNSEKQDTAELSITSFNEKTETPTLMDTRSLRSLKGQLKSRTVLQQAIELSLRTPASVRKVVMERAESLDTLSPCESICSDDLMMDFDVNSSVDSIDRSSVSVRSRSGSDIHKIDETDLLMEFERKGSKIMKDLNSLLHVKINRKPEKQSVIANLPARATRLLNRSRLQEQCTPEHGTGSVNSSRSNSAHRHHIAGSRASTAPTAKRHQRRSDTHSSSDDLMLYDKSFRNAMIQDVLQFKKQLLRLRRILQETETVNPFEADNGQQLFAACGLDSKLLDDFDLGSLSSSISQEPLKELADLRRQVVYLQGQVDDRDRTIRLQRDLIEKLEAEKVTLSGMQSGGVTKEWINTATQTERTRPLTIGAEGLSRSKPEFTSYTTHFPVLCNDSTTIIRHQQQYPGNCFHALNRTRRHTIISTTLTNYNHQQLAASGDDLHCGSIDWQAQKMPLPSQPIVQQLPYKPVRITLIGDLPEANRSTTSAEFSISELENKRNRVKEHRSAHRNDPDNNNFPISMLEGMRTIPTKAEHKQHKPTPSSFPQLHCPTVTIV